MSKINWSIEEDLILRKHYFSKSKKFILSKLKRNWVGIHKRASRLGLKRDKKFQYKGMINNTLNNNPMKNLNSRLKCSVSNTKNGIKKTRDVKRMNLLQEKGFICNSCGKMKDARKLVIHHIDGDRKNNSNDNFMILCFACHSKIHYFGGGSLLFDELKSIKSVGYENTFDLHTPIYNNFFLGNKVLSHNSGKSCVALTLAVDWMNKPIIVDDICFTTDELLKRAMTIGRNHTLIQDEQINQLGAGSQREQYERQTLEDTTRKFGLNILFCSPTTRDHTTAHYNLEIICINKKKRLTKIAIIGSGSNYMGYFVIKVLPESNKLWKAYNSKKDAFIKDILSRSTQRLSLDDMSEAVKKHRMFPFARTSSEMKIIAMKVFPTLTIQEIGMIVDNIRMLDRMKELGGIDED